jgi:hypothetical protein
MSLFHCSCGHATDDPEDYADHLGWVFDPDDDSQRHIPVNPATGTPTSRPPSDPMAKP